jgi:hypothetical protein
VLSISLDCNDVLFVLDVGAVHALHLDLADLNSVEAFAGGQPI